MSNENKQQEGSDIFVARQPIFDAGKNVFAYELLFRKGFHNYASKFDTEYATIKVISNSLIMGLERLTAGKKAFIKFNRQLLVGNIPRLFPVERLGVEIQKGMEPEETVIDTLAKLKAAGYTLIMDDFTFEEKLRPLLQFIDIVKVDFLARDSAYRGDIIKKVKAGHVRFLAEKIETKEHFEEAMKLGYRYFQGFFFQKPDVVSSREMPGYKFNYLQILKKTCDPDMPLEDIETILKHDVSLTYKLLRFINSASYSFKVTVRSIRHALVLLGKREIKKWLTLIALSGIGGGKPVELMNSTLIRARFCELIGKELSLKEETADFFLVGMFSMADAFLDRSMEEILSDLPLDTTIKSALMGEKGILRETLDLVLTYEKADWAEAARLAGELKLGEGKIVSHYIESVHWVRSF